MQRKSIETVATRKTAAQVIAGILLLLCGIGIYLLFRSETIRLNQWFSAIGHSETVDILRQGVQQWNVPEFVKFSLPDGLYCASYILLMDAVWHKSRTWPRIAASSAMPLVAIGHELLQGAGLARGTFDWCDLLSYALPLVAYLLLITKKKTKTH